jgi:hypothetical protein
MNIAAFTARHVAEAEAQAARYRAEARSDRKKADAALGFGDRAGYERWMRQAARCDQWAAESEKTADDFRAINAEVLA